MVDGYNLGRRPIHDDNRARFSRRAKNHKISVVRQKCIHCGHHKVFYKQSGDFCCRCKKEQK